MAPKPKRASGRYKPGSRTRSSGYKGKSNWDGTTKAALDLETKREKVRCRAAAIKNKGIRVLSVGCKVKDEIKVKIEACEDTVSDQGSGSGSQIPLTSAGDEVDEDSQLQCQRASVGRFAANITGVSPVMSRSQG
jgi:hypothetical protein